MTALRFTQFSGEIPRLISRLLPDTGAQVAENIRLNDGGLTPIRKPRQEHTFGTSDIQTIVKFDDEWLSWSTPVNAAPGPVATDRLYYTGDGVPKMRVGGVVYELAVPAPTAALTGTPSGSGSGDVITRLYVYTWVTDFGEESEPCPISAEIAWQSGITITLSGFQSTPAGRAISKQRIYRSQSSNQAGTDLFLIQERSATTSNYVDTHGPTDFAEALPSKDYNPPPDDLAGLVSMPNGMMAGFVGKQLCFSEPYKPHAWPEKYRLTAAYPIVGLGSYGTTIVAGTTGYPFVASGNSPESMVQEKIEVNLPCINGRGLVDLGYSVAYPSNDGLVVVSNAGAQLATQALYTREKWQKLTPESLIGAQYAGRYFASFTTVELDSTVTRGTRIIDLSGEQPFVLRASIAPTAFFYALEEGKLYYLVDDTVYEWDAVGQTNEVMTWTSKRIILAAPASFGAFLAESGALLSADDQAAQDAAIAAIEAENAAIFAGDMNAEVDGAEIDYFSLAGDAMQPFPGPKYISIRIYADGKLIRTVTELDKVKRIKGVKAKVWEIQVNGTAEVDQMTIATTAAELNAV